ncbi:hypothetical protein NQZ68_014102 [Dissostichus eleginoides]|nr:hypothetical protein NQZ68_014102 [Dissostichus eleginoides]
MDGQTIREEAEKQEERGERGESKTALKRSFEENVMGEEKHLRDIFLDQYNSTSISMLSAATDYTHTGRAGLQAADYSVHTAPRNLLRTTLSLEVAIWRMYGSLGTAE